MLLIKNANNPELFARNYNFQMLIICFHIIMSLPVMQLLCNKVKVSVFFWGGGYPFFPPSELNYLLKLIMWMVVLFFK